MKLSIPKFVHLLSPCILFFLSLFSLESENRFNQNQLKEQEDKLKLSLILKKTSEYCQRLENAALDFVCYEEVAEKIDLSRDIVQKFSGKEISASARIKFPERFVINKYLYDYQFVRQNNKIKEKRTLLEENGSKKNEPDAKLKTEVFHYENILFGPIWLLKENIQRYYEYKIIDAEILNGEKTVIIQAVSIPPLQSKVLSGKVWLKEDDSSILKIEWIPRSIGNFETIEKRAEKYNATPLIISISEYGLEKNGIRFPTRDFTEEGYLTKKGKKFIRSETTIVYSNYKFFTVETEVKY